MTIDKITIESNGIVGGYDYEIYYVPDNLEHSNVEVGNERTLKEVMDLLNGFRVRNKIL